MVQKYRILITEAKELFSLVNINGFAEVYFSNLKHFKKNYECYESLEDLYLETFGQRRFSCYESFMVCLKLFKKKCQKNK